MNEEMISCHLRVLTQWPGGRPPGSAANHTAEAYLADALGAAGYTVERPAFDVVNWQIDGVELWVGDGPLPVIANPYSPPCDITARLVAAGSIDELEAAELSGHIALLHGALTAETLIPRNFPFFTVPEHQHIVALLEERGALAVVCVSPAVGPPAPVIEDGDFSLPSVTVAADAGAVLLATPGPVRLRIRSRALPGRAANVIGYLPHPARNKVILCAHFDTKPGTPGALDNAAGTVAVLALAGQLARRSPATSLEVVFFNGEDHYASPGEVAYLENCGGELSRVALVVNIDAVGRRDQPATIAFFGTPEPWSEEIRAAMAGRTDVVETAPWPQGDHMIFAMRGVPCIAVTSGGIHDLIASVLHTPDDTLDLVDPGRIASAVDFLADLLLQNHIRTRIAMTTGQS